MASISTSKTGRRTIQFVRADGSRPSIRLGKVSQRQAEAIRDRVDDLVAASMTGQPSSRQTAMWLDEIDEVLRGKLASVGLVNAKKTAKLAAWIDQYIASQSVKDSTLLTYKRAKNHLVGFFGVARDLRTITPGDADQWWTWMRIERKPKLADNTARKSVSIARQFIKAAMRQRLIEADPFVELSSSVRPNRKRDHFVTPEEAVKVLEACPDAEWRLMFALGRYGGLRVPSEIRNLRWSDIDWEKERFTVHATKTEHHDNGGIRVVPIFPELLPHLHEAFKSAQPGTDYVIARYRHAGSNVATQLIRIVKRAGLVPWPKIWQNLRASRETELVANHSLHVVTAWIGNTPKIAMGHYLQVREDDYAKAVQNPVQHLHETPCKAKQANAQAESLHFDTAGDSVETRSDAVACTGPHLASDGPYWT